MLWRVTVTECLPQRLGMYKKYIIPLFEAPVESLGLRLLTKNLYMYIVLFSSGLCPSPKSAIKKERLRAHRFNGYHYDFSGICNVVYQL